MNTTTQHTNLSTYTSTLLPAGALTVLVDGLRQAFTAGHPDDQTPPDAWSDEDGAWSPGGVWSRVTDPACMTRRDHAQACLRFSYHVLGVRAAGTDNMTELVAAIHHDCETLGQLIDHPWLGLIQPSYATRHGIKAPARLS
ncbi:MULTISPECIES: hypothetical protein [unclassified Kribbella]|uniref:hypothetical protein n=1 Tax=unclassified Kribbella TaxID=2644121 RepID=UPI0030768CDD